MYAAILTQENLSGTAQTTTAVTCESCHGGAVDWIEEHNQKSISRAQRVESSLALGMGHPESILSVSRSCFECHIVDDEQLVNHAGHPALTEGFELLSWYSGEVKHNFSCVEWWIVRQGALGKDAGSPVTATAYAFP